MCLRLRWSVRWSWPCAGPGTRGKGGKGLEGEVGDPFCGLGGRDMAVGDIESTAPVRPIEWADGIVRILDQRRLPRAERYLKARKPEDVAEAIRTLAVRGAPLLGIAAAYGMGLAARHSKARGLRGVLRDLGRAGKLLKASRPTAANISWAVERVIQAGWRAVRSGVPKGSEGADVVRRVVMDEAIRIALEDEASCEVIGRLGEELLPEKANVLDRKSTRLNS